MPRARRALAREGDLGESIAALELLDQPPLGYVKRVGFKPDLLSGQVVTNFTLTMPLLMNLKFAQLGIAGKARVSDIKSNGLPGGLVVSSALTLPIQ